MRYCEKRLVLTLLASLLLLCSSAVPSMANRRAFTPAPGTPLRTEIMNAARMATHTNERFIVGELVVLENGTAGSAFAEIMIESRSQEISGLFLFRKVAGTWTALAMMGGGGGSRECADVMVIVHDFESEAQKLGFAEQVLPKAFFTYRDEARRGGSDCRVAERLGTGSDVTTSTGIVDLKIGLPDGPFIKPHRDYHVAAYVLSLFQNGGVHPMVVKAIAQSLTHAAFDDAIMSAVKIPFDPRRVKEFKSLADESLRLEARVAECVEENTKQYARRQLSVPKERRDGEIAVAVEDIASLCLEAFASDLSVLAEAMNTATQRLRP